MPGHPARNRMDGALYSGAVFMSLSAKLLYKVLGLRYRHAVSRNDNNILRAILRIETGFALTGRRQPPVLLLADFTEPSPFKLCQKRLEGFGGVAEGREWTPSLRL